MHRPYLVLHSSVLAQFVSDQLPPPLRVPPPEPQPRGWYRGFEKRARR